jgi:7,8-dihydropterin-6-yl-methyl-4-(beta-D-ribofuranosyl)aminobenzene 5'-phosphate synthase
MAEEIRIKIIADNNVKGDLIKEHGFAAWIEAYGRKILFDTGQGKALSYNSGKIGCDLASADMLVLSHGHYDHCGSIAEALKRNPSMPVYCSRGVLATRFSIDPATGSREISIPPGEKRALLAIPDSRMNWINAPVRTGSDTWISGPVPRNNPLEDTGGSFFLDPEGTDPDPIEDDLSMWIFTDCGPIIVTGCCHSGIINTAEHLRRVTGEERLLGIIGGLHLVNASLPRMRETVEYFRKRDPEFIIPCHCTGDSAVEYLRTEFGEKITPGYAGLDRVFLCTK